MSNLRQKLQTLFIVMLLGIVTAAAQEIRYVKIGGDDTKDGRSWENAKANIQAAINDLVTNNLTGEVWVTVGKYYPTETTDASSSPYYKSFKIPAGITVRGGFKSGLEGQSKEGVNTTETRPMKDDKNFGKTSASGTLDGESSNGGVYYWADAPGKEKQTILCGDVSPTKQVEFKWDATKEQFQTTFYGNSYHVVWFAMGGFDDNGRALPLSKPAKLEGCVIEGGHAYTRDALSPHPHVGYGGGIYMVANSFVYNCEVRHCDASRNGGGIYMDGGGIVRRTYVHDCQALGLGTDFGLGGGICEDGAKHNSKANPVVVAQSVVTNCVGRMGGGMALVADQTVGKNKYTVVVNSSVVNNNTAQVEAGGVYTYKGGGLASTTVVNNKCIGSGITQNGVITGRAGGVYSRDASYIGNTVIWGNKCEANKDMQYANSRSSLADDEKSKFLHSALSNADVVDWSTTERLNVVSLETENSTETTSKSNKGYALFKEPTTKTVAGQKVSVAGYYPEAVTGTAWDWSVYSESALTYAGINTADLDKEGLTPAPTGKQYDMQFGQFNSRPTIGALVSEIPDIAPKGKGTSKEEYFVDPNFIYTKNNTEDNGVNWTKPARFLGSVLDHIAKQSRAAAPEKEVIIYVKEGTVDNTRYNTGDDRVRNTSLEIPSNVTILGSYDATLTGEDLSRRNPVLTPTVISGKLLDDYKYNVAHLIKIDGKENITIDGFKLTFANAYSTELGNADIYGAAITLKNCYKHEGEESANIHFRNITVSNSLAERGAVVYAEKSAADFENCIFHNNTTARVDHSGLIHGVLGSDLRFNHCNVLRSVGHASYLDETTSNNWKNSMFYGNLDRAQDNTNSCDEFSILAFEGEGLTRGNLTGERCMFDRKSKEAYDALLGGGIPKNSTYYKRTNSINEPDHIVDNPNGLEYAYTSGWANGYPRMVNPTKNAGYSTEGDVTYYGRATSFEPHNDNPVVNAAGTGGEPHSARSWGKDITTVITRDFGGLPDIGAVESHVASADEIANENGNPDGQMPYGVAYYVRDYAQDNMPQTYTKTTTAGGDTYTEAVDGKGNYVLEGTDNYVFLDGASWQYAVSGNANYGEGITTVKDVNTEWKAVQGPGSQTFNGKFKIHSGTSYIGVYGTNATLTNEANAAEWTVSDITTDDANLEGTTRKVTTTIGGTTYYLIIYNNNPYLYNRTPSRNVTLTKSGNNAYTYYYNGRYLRNNNGLTTTDKSNQATAWTFTPQYTVTPGAWSEESVPNTGTYDRTSVSASDPVSEPLDLHVYTSKEDIDHLGTANIVKYQIKLAGSTIYAYDAEGTNHNIRGRNSNPHSFALISSGIEDQYYLYDINTSRYLYNNAGSNNNPVRASETTRTPWRITKDASNTNAFNITVGTTPLADNTPGWSYEDSQYIRLSNRASGTNQEWVLVAEKAYTNKYTTTTVTSGEYINGLQYAVNTVNAEFTKTGEKHQVHVGKGTYTNRTGAASGSDSSKNIESQPYAYEMKQGVDVLGGYPNVGNPGEEQRQPKLFETILQPAAANPYVDMEFNKLETENEGYSKMEVADGKWGAYVNQTDANDAASFARVLVQANHFATQTLWDGFTIQNGYLNTAYSQNIGKSLANLYPAEVRYSGGAGVLIQDNGIIENCVVRDNVILISPAQVNTDKMIQTGNDKSENTDHIYTFITGGAGVFMSATMEKEGQYKDKKVTGVGGIVRNCEIYDNQLIDKAFIRYTGESKHRPDNVWQFGGGIYQNGGDVFNTIVHDNFAVTLLGDDNRGRATGSDQNNEMMLGAGVFVSRGNFYNNTIVHNIACTYFQNHDNHCSFGGVHVFDEATIYNSLVADNKGHWSYEHWTTGTNPGNGVPVSAFKENATDRFSRDETKVHVKYSFVDVEYKKTVTLKDEQKQDRPCPVDLVSYNDERDEHGDAIPGTNIYLDKDQGKPESEKRTTPYSLTQVYYPKGNAKQYQLIVDNTNTSPCVNTGTESIWDPIAQAYVVIPDVDAKYTDRIKDCRIDIGAYESDGAAFIHPQMFDASGNATNVAENAKQLIFYVSPDGFGKTDASDPENAACAPKLQRVIDAAGRYKILNPEKQVIVKVANSWSMLHPDNGTTEPTADGYIEPSNFTYYATRTADQTSTDTRMWSTIIPRGVEVWGGYTDVPAHLENDVITKNDNQTWSNSNNGYTYRSITGNPTYIDSYFYNKDMKINATTYHVVTFTERVYDADGKPYLAADFNKSTNTLNEYSSYNGSQRDEALFLHMNEVLGTDNVKKVHEKVISNRAVLDGMFITGGNADGKALSGSAILNANGYGGAAIVTDYALVRNCIVTNNSASNGGGLALTDRAVVSGSLIMHNNADYMGGGLYVFEDGAELSNGTKIKSLRQDGDPTMDYRMAHVLTSTIVSNYANIDGGGVWYNNSGDANARFNSVVIWQNDSKGQANVYGLMHPEQPTEDETLADEYYPFAYSVIQNIRASGTNNMSAEPFNHSGVRFVAKTADFGQANPDKFQLAEEVSDPDQAKKYANFGYYGLTSYSILCSNGMPADKYNQLKAAMAVADDDILGKERVHAGNKFVEIGARALAKEFAKKQLMLRLFVANPEDVDTETAGKFMRLSTTATSGTPAEYYSQEGSSFAYPFNSLQDALDYIKAARNNTLGISGGSSDSRDLPFEILVGKGTYYPKKDLNGGTMSVWAQTFAIPEGVTIIGGFNPQGGGGTYYGRYNEPKATIDNRTVNESSGKSAMSIYNNVQPIPTTGPATGEHEIGRGYKYGEERVTPVGGSEITFQQWDIQDICDRRGMNDNNKNGIIEPWEFKNQTIISGNAVNGETDGVYHVMTAVADADAVGNLPTAGYRYNVTFPTAGDENGYKCWEYGQQIRLNGLIITGGNGLTYLKTALDEYGKYIYYQGAGLQVDGNRYKANIDAPSAAHTEPVFHNSAAYGVGYRDIPISIINCQFRNNIAGYGGAISTNGTLDTYASSFEQNLAVAQTEKPKTGETWITDVDPAHKGQSVTKVMYPGQGGAILATGQVSCYNTLFANNEARMGTNDTPTIDLVKHPTFRVPDENAASSTLRAAGGAIMVGSAGRYHMMNCDFVRNKANAYPVIFTMNPNSTEDEKEKDAETSTENYNQFVSTVVWGNEVNKVRNDNPYYNFASKMMVNVGKKAKGSDGKYPQYDPSFKAGNVPLNQADLDQNWKEFVWFSAYEDGVGFTTNNKYDLRDYIIFKTREFVNWNIKAAAKKVDPSLPEITASDAYFQNCNIQIVAENEDVAGPNFGIPSVRAGYDGFMEGADWSPARINRLTDNGSGWIKQSVDNSTLKVTFHDKDVPGPGETKNDYYQGGYPVAHYDTWPEYKLWLAIGNEKYMQATSEAEENEVFINGTSLGHPQKNLPRISPDPTLGVTKAYIDIGVYEYQKQPMVKPGSEVDILWVSTEEHPENGPATGATWRTPTSDLQKAIETLLSSRNGHKKEIRLMEGEYAPINTKSIGGTNYSAFVIDTKSLNGRAITPSTFDTDNKNEKYYAQSITIKGGYSKDIIYEHDPAQYKTVIRQSKKMDGANTDYLIYIADPTVRYAYKETSTGVSGYTADNQFGAKVDGADDVNARTPKTMPVQVDGVTLINDMATAETKGSAIYYPDYDGTSAPETGIRGAHPTSVGGKVVYYPSKEEMDKIDPVTHKHNGTTVDHETEFALITDEGSNTVSDTKLLVTKTLVVGSGNKSDVPTNASAVYIGKKGGAALIYNSVFHSNYGMPLDAWNTINVNNTFGKNKGLVNLQDDADVKDAHNAVINSQIHNSALWMNNNNAAQFSMPNVSVVATEGDTKGDVSGDGKANFTYNSFTGGNIKYADYDKTAGEGGHVAGNNYNTGLSDINKDLANGPNFVDPENVDIYARNFDIRPSVRLLNKGNGTRTPAVAPATVDTYAGLYNDLVVASKYDFSLASTTDKDVLSRMRIVSEGSPQKIDVGAYEFQGTLQQVLYVDPNKTHRDEATGENWDDSFGYGDLQDAVDLAGIYHMNSATKDESYVFVKGNSSTNQGKNTNETLTIRDGVTVYGSIIDGYTDWHDITEDDGEGHQVPKYSTIEEFIADMTFNREGVASNAASKTIVTGIKTSEYTAFDGNPVVGEETKSTPAIVDGFVVTDPNPATAPVLDVTNESEKAVIVVRNVVVADNTIDNSATGTDVNVAHISNGLIYEALFRDNKPKGNGAVLKVSNNPEGAYSSSTTTSGYAVNVTVEGKTVGADFDPAHADSYVLPVDGKRGTTDVESATQIFKSITNSINSGSGTYKAGAAAPYGQITNPGISGYFYNIADPNLNYQLTETSKYIDMCEAVNPLSAIPEAANLVQFINYETDRDLLGNPRWMRNVSKDDLIDRGAFETWKVDKNFVCGKWQKNSTWYGTNKSLDDAIAPHFYPHDGSVVYVMENKNLVIDPLGDNDVKATPENPGFLLVKKGANFYGNGRPVTAAYVAIERDVRKGGSIVAVPYAMNYNSTESVAKVQTETHDGHADLFLNKQNGSAAYKYSGNERMDWKYIFQTTDTKCWDQVSATAANQGALFQPYQGSEWYPAGDDNTTALLRFTGKGANLTDYIYHENGVSKDVTLTKYDDSESTNDGADYTDEKDMGWNCFGIPYLVSEYKPYEKVSVTDADRNIVEKDDEHGNISMDIAHILWLYYDGKHTPDFVPETDPEDTKLVNGDGGYYSVNSWESSNNLSLTNPWHVSDVSQQALWVGEGIFTQTATLQDTEALKFWLPVAPTSFPSPSSAKSVVRYYCDGTGIEETVSSDDVELVGTEYYTVDGLRIERPRRGQVVIIRNLYSNGSAKTSKMFVK